MHILAEVSSVMHLKSRRYVNGSRPHSRRRGVKRRERRKMLKEQLSIQVDTVSPSSAMCPDDPLFVDVTQFDEDPVENLPSPRGGSCRGFGCSLASSFIWSGGSPLLYVHGVWTSFVKCILTFRDDFGFI